MSADKPFQFVIAAYLTRIDNLKVTNLEEMRDGLDQATDASIFHHTFQSRQEHHFLTDGFSNDFAHWVQTGLNRPELAEQLGSLDIRDYVSLADLRGDLRRIVTDYCRTHPRETEISAFEPFYFCESVEVTVPTGVEAHGLEDFRKGVRHAARSCFYYHFIASRLRLHLRTNDFSKWLEDSLALPELAKRVEAIDIYTNTLDETREVVLSLLDQESLTRI